MVFSIQLDRDGIPTTDLGYQLIQACRFQNWYSNSAQYIVIGVNHNNELVPLTDGQFKLSDDKKHIKLPPNPFYESYIPVGTIEFTEKFLGKKIKPINIPKQLATKTFLKRNIFRGTVEEFMNRKGSLGISDKKWYYVKTDDTIKEIETTAYRVPDILNLDITKRKIKFLFSEIIPGNIESEWRVFVYKGKVVGVHQYAGAEFSALPSQSTIQSMISKYTDSPKCYTLDVAVTNIKTPSGNQRHTVLIEVHNFIACGLYGFEQYNILPQMVIQGFIWEMNRGDKH